MSLAYPCKRAPLSHCAAPPSGEDESAEAGHAKISKGQGERRGCARQPFSDTDETRAHAGLPLPISQSIKALTRVWTSPSQNVTQLEGGENAARGALGAGGGGTPVALAAPVLDTEMAPKADQVRAGPSQALERPLACLGKGY